MKFEDARNVEISDRLIADVVIVGAGAAGITLALELAKRSIDVLLLEAGDQRFSKASQQYFAAEAVEPASHGPVDMFRRRVFGGSTSVWGGRCIPFDPIDFERRPWMTHAQWPITYEDVAQHYPEALEYSLAGLPEFIADDAFASGGALLATNSSPDVILNRIERFSHPTNFGTWYAPQLRAARTLRVLTNAPVSEILTDAGGRRAAGVALRTENGRSLMVSANRVVIAAGGLETARLLLASTSSDHPRGLGNERDLVGRFYQCHLEGVGGSITFSHLSNPKIDYEISHDGVYCRRFIWLSPAAQRHHRLAGLVLRPAHPSIVDPGHRHPVLSAMYLVKNWIVPEYAKKMTSLESAALRTLQSTGIGFYSAHLKNIILGAPSLAQFGAMWTRKRILAQRKIPSVVLSDPRSIYPIDINAEQEPNPESRVTLGESQDRLGMRKLRIDWRTTDGDHHRLAEGLSVLQQAFASNPSAKLEIDQEWLSEYAVRPIPVGGHHIGTARMSASPASGVCDANGELFSTSGVYIAGAAAFPTSGFANPTLTILAMTLRLASHLATADPIAR